MKKLLKIIYSPRTTLGLLVIFALALAVATFIENSYDTATAKLLIYNAKWFEVLMLLMIFNFIGSVQRYQLLTWKRFSGFLFHTAFIIIIIGAGVTRYIGFEGMMHIREGASSNFIYSNLNYLNVRASDGSKNYYFDKEMNLSMIGDNTFQIKVETEEKGTVSIRYKDLIRNAKESYVESEKGFAMLELTLRVDGHQDDITLKHGAVEFVHNFPVSFNNASRPDGLMITGTPDELRVSFAGDIKTSRMPDMEAGLIPKDSLGEFTKMTLYEPLGTGMAVVLNKVFRNTAIAYVEADDDERRPSALILDVSLNGKTQEVTVLGGSGYMENYVEVPLDDLSLKLAYGAKKITLPFALQLRKFELERYAGSMSPSSYASEVTLIDQNKGITRDHRIFMNNVLDYEGYRFFQSSYDQDEKGTVLSVNHDYWGTMITYLGYALMIIGFIWTLFNRNSRYWSLMGMIRQARARRKALLINGLFLVFSGALFSQQAHQDHQHDASPYSVTEAHADQFGELVVQNFEGRFEPVHTLAIDVMHKISRKDVFDIPERGKLSLIQVFLDMPLNPEFWKTQDIIYVREQAVSDIIGIKGKHASFNDFFNDNGAYKLADFAETAFRKADAERNKFDKELIKLNERLEVFMMTTQGNMLDIFPVQNSKNNKWVSWEDPSAQRPLTGSIRIINDDLQLPQFNYAGIMRTYFLELIEATKTADYTRADKILGYIKSIQRQNSTANVIPSEAKIKKEISYNKSNIFKNLKNVYGLLSVVLLLLTFIDNLRTKSNKVLSTVLYIAIGILALAFLYHTYGMGMRWYLSGHAPWSNGYEALILVSWSSLLAGFCFMRYSKITLAATALLAFFTLMTAGHSNYDPQLTNLQPVLKSYWLIIHVATLTISYGFLGLGFILGLFNMGLYLTKTTKNWNRVSLMIKELTYINEMNLTIGLLLATVGTFLGGVWANESWGRYWGWDAKETWALVITIVYTIILHMRLAPKIKGEYIFNVAAVFGFGSVLMTFFGVNYYFTKGMHSYASGETPVFPIWAWITILTIIVFITAAGLKEWYYRKQYPE
ncbi:cytochrome c biogenesis protein [Aestuariivivens sediminicola]|uniref:cytochrome c biogenesis protein n=1 Tax=Aestuariivivens sediminicola TaxID=2913560 RepID=UPI001F574576|nr:cytochrome c biogenesis protein CcsA [Aestuariivivens sediminicola]